MLSQHKHFFRNRLIFNKTKKIRNVSVGLKLTAIIKNDGVSANYRFALNSGCMKIIFIHPNNIFNVQGSTEPYYVYKYLRNRYHIITLINSNQDNKAKSIFRRVFLLRWTPLWLFWDIKSLIRVLSLRFEIGDIVWTYRGIILTPLFLRWRYRCKWVSDFRTPPIEQEIEFSKIRHTFGVAKFIYYGIMKFIYKKCLRLAHKVIVITPLLRDYMVGKYSIPINHIFVLEQGVDLERFIAKKRQKFNPYEPRLIIVSPVAPERGLECLLYAIKILVDKGLNPKVSFVGAGSQVDVNTLKELSRKLSLYTQIEWKGYVAHDEMPALLSDHDFGLSYVPDLLSYRMSSPTKVFEYLAVGLAVIASDILAHRAIIKDRHNGVLVKPGDPEAWADSIEELCKDEKKRVAIQCRARESVRKHDWNNKIAELITNL